MGGGGKGGSGGSSDAAKQARRDEQERQARIREGTAHINTIFDGGLRGTDLLTSFSQYDPNATYYTADGSRWRPQPPREVQQTVYGNVPGQPAAQQPVGRTQLSQEQLLQNLTAANSPNRDGGGVQQPVGRTQLSQEQMLQNVLASTGPLNRDGGGDPQSYAVGTQTVTQGPSIRSQFQDAMQDGGVYRGRERASGFDDDFFQGRRQAYLDYATPQVQDQYSDAQRDMTYSLARGGLLDSSVRGQKAGDLQEMYDLNMQQVGDQALDYETQARNAVEDARSSLIQQLNVTGDAQGAVNAAQARAQALTQTPAFSPLSNLFSAFTEGLGQRYAHERAEAMQQSFGGGAPRYQQSPARVETR